MTTSPIKPSPIFSHIQIGKKKNQNKAYHIALPQIANVHTN